MRSIPQNYVQCTFDFDALSDEIVDDVLLPTSPVPPRKKYCPDCKQWLSLDCFYKHGGTKDKLHCCCKACQRSKQAPTYARRKEQGLCIKCLAPTFHQGIHCEQCRSRLKQSRKETSSNKVVSKRLADKLRDEVLAAYGGVCVQCGESHPAFLSVDHMNDDGAEHRRQTGNGGRFYQWLRKNGFPQDRFQLLCANCNWLKYISKKNGEKTYNQLWNAHLRQEVLTAYGGVCACCGEDRPEVLTVDHVKNDGAEHRREIGRGGAPLYAWLRKQGFPQDGRFQLLCFNCNRARYYHEVCPHQQ